MNVLSLFDGMSCGQIALNRLGIKYDNYFACEIDKYAIKVTQHNYPNTIQLGDVTKIDFTKLPKIDLLIGGSPCQGFSFAGKQLAFDDPRSKLFFEYVRALKETNPRYFLLENVVMKKEYEQVITDMLGVNPIMINSSLVSAQNRKRLYWTNIPNITQPEDKNIKVEDIVLDSHIIAARQVGRRIDENGKRDDYNKDIEIKQRIEINENPDKTNCLTSVQKDNVLLTWADVMEKDAKNVYYVTEKMLAWINKSEDRKKKLKIYNKNTQTKMQMLEASHHKGISNQRCFMIDDVKGYRYISPIECERLQTVPDNYTSCVSNTQRYRMLGNGWTVDVICHILKNMELK